MLTKQVTFLGKTSSGIFSQSLFGSSGAFEKVAGAPAFADWETGDELRKYISTITAEDRRKYVYVLVNALGAGEYFGSNINADYFPWDALCHEGDDYGYKTFLKAHAFQHHKNKDPDRAFGIPVLSVLNHKMKRVELIVRLDREKAKLEGADGIITRIEAGEFPDVSMGCKVPFDICSKCGNRSKTKDDYCVHMNPPEELRGKYGPNVILPDGSKIYVLNTYPRFFDISFVFIGADKTAKVMAKLASVGRQLCLGDVCTLSARSPLLYGPTGVPLEETPVRSQGVEKTASAKSCACGCGGCEEMAKLAEGFGYSKTAHEKLSEMIKNVPAGVFALKKLPELEKAEPELSSGLLKSMASRDLGSSLGTAASMGIVLKPTEFQKIVLHRMGEVDLAEELHRQHKVFREVPEVDDSINVDPAAKDVGLAENLSHLVPERSAFGPMLQIRVMKITISPMKKTLPTLEKVAHPLLDKISAAYNGYRRNLLTKLSQAVEVVESDPNLRKTVLGTNVADMYIKTATAQTVTDDSMAYLVGAHVSDRSLLCNTAGASAIAAGNEWLLNGEDHSPA
jgi:hypothetical protein